MEDIRVVDVLGIHTEVYARIPTNYSPLKIVIIPGTVYIWFPRRDPLTIEKKKK